MLLTDGMIVVIGHGPSIVGAGLGNWLDSQIVIRLKQPPMPYHVDWGTRTDYVSTTRTQYVTKRLQAEYWVYGPPHPDYRHADVNRWNDYFRQFSDKKPSNGLCACFCAVQFLQPARLGVIGFDSILKPDNSKTGKWHDKRPGAWGHDQKAENLAMHSLGVEIIDLCSQPPNT